MPKERALNPVAAQHKADKKAALKKSKATTQSQRNERLAKRNPERLARQVEELKELEASGGAPLRHKDKEHLEHLERELRAVRKARDVLGDKAPLFKGPAAGRSRGEQNGAGDGRGGAAAVRAGMGKRRRDDESETDDDVRRIPMPEDTPPPIPRRYLDTEIKAQEQKKVAAPQQTVYSSEPQLRDIGKEVRRFVPSAVATKIARAKPEPGKLLEPEELDRLEAEGYAAAQKAAEEAEHEAEHLMLAAGNELDADKTLRKVEMEEVDDEDA